MSHLVSRWILNYGIRMKKRDWSMAPEIIQELRNTPHPFDTWENFANSSTQNFWYGSLLPLAGAPSIAGRAATCWHVRRKADCGRQTPIFSWSFKYPFPCLWFSQYENFKSLPTSGHAYLVHFFSPYILRMRNVELALLFCLISDLLLCVLFVFNSSISNKSCTNVHSA